MLAMAEPTAVWSPKSLSSGASAPGPCKVVVFIPGAYTSSQLLWQRVIALLSQRVRVVAFEHPRGDCYPISPESSTDSVFSHTDYAGFILRQLQQELGDDFDTAEIGLVAESAGMLTALELLRLFQRNNQLGKVKLVVGESALGLPQHLAMPKHLLRLLPRLILPRRLEVVLGYLAVPRQFRRHANLDDLRRHRWYINTTPTTVRRAYLEALVNYDGGWHTPGIFGRVPYQELRASHEKFVHNGPAASHLCWMFGFHPSQVSRVLPQTVHSGHVEAPHIWDPALVELLTGAGFLPGAVQLSS